MIKISGDEFDDSIATPSSATKSTASLAERKRIEAENAAKVAAINAAEKKKTLSNMLKNTPIGQIVANPVVQSIGGKADIAKLSTAGKNGGAVQNTAGQVTGKASDVVDPGTDHSKTIEGPLEKADRAAGQEYAKSSGPILEPKAAVTVPNAAIAAGAKSTAGTVASSGKQVPNNIATDVKSGVNNAANRAVTTIEDKLGAQIQEWFQGTSAAGAQPMLPPSVFTNGGGIAGVPGAGGVAAAAPLAQVAYQSANAAQVANNSQYNPQQAALINQLMLQAQGQGGPSPAELMLQQQNQQNVNNAMALAASQSGRGLPVAQRQIMQNAALGGQQAAQQAAIMRAQEMLQAQGLAGSTIQAARQSDLGVNEANAQMQQQAALQNAQNKLAASQANASNQLASNAQGQDVYKANLNASLQQRGQDISVQNANIAAAQAEQARKDSILNGIMSGIGSAYASSVGGSK
jgi:hypothetical protein